MAKPILYTITPFDKINEYKVRFTYDGSQAKQNRLIIKNYKTLSVVYDQTIVNYRLEHIIPANTLENGVTYSVQVQVYDVYGNSTELSNEIIFTCLATPSFYFKNLNSNQIIETINYEVSLFYSQEQGEKLNSYYIVLYDSNNHVVHKSTTNYNTDSLYYILEGLNNTSTYYIEAHGQTINGIAISTAKIPFTVEYSQPSVFSVIQIENDSTQGIVNVKSNMISVDGKYNGNPTYVNGQRIDLSSGEPVIFNEGFNLTASFSMQIKIMNFNIGVPIIKIDDDVIITIHPANKYGTHAGEYYVQLTSQSGLYTYVIHSNYFVAKQILINIRRNDGLFSLDVMEVS